jgi:hypothetical protein
VERIEMSLLVFSVQLSGIADEAALETSSLKTSN